MKQGRTLQELAIEIDRQAKTKKDFLADTTAMSVIPHEEGIRFQAEGMSADFGINDIAHSQIGQHLEIPARYYERMRTESPELLSQNINHWLHNRVPERRMLRTLDGNLRAFLSAKYRRIDNMEIAETVLPIISRMEGAKVESCQITEQKMYIKVVNPRITTEVRKGDIVQAGIVISNSEVGMGSVSISPLIYRLVCSNGMIAAQQVRKNHVGRLNDADVDMSIFRDETIEADDRAFLMKVQDAVNAAVDQTVFEKIVQQMRDATEAKIEAATVPKVVELASKQFHISQFESEGVLGHLIGGGDLSLYGMANAVTRYAQDVSSYDRSTELEQIGYSILTVAPTIWRGILSAARKEV